MCVRSCPADNRIAAGHRDRILRRQAAIMRQAIPSSSAMRLSSIGTGGHADWRTHVAIMQSEINIRKSQPIEGICRKPIGVRQIPFALVRLDSYRQLTFSEL